MTLKDMEALILRTAEPPRLLKVECLKLRYKLIMEEVIMEIAYTYGKI